MSRGLAAGATAMFLVTAVLRLFPNACFGAWPLVLGLLPFAAGVALRRPLLLGTIPATPRRFAAPALALLLPALFWLKYLVTGGLPMLDGTCSALQFFWLLLIGAVFGGLTLDAVAASWTGSHANLSSAGGLLAGLGVGIGVMVLAQDTLSLPLLWLLQAAMAAATLLTAHDHGDPSTQDTTARKKTPRARLLPAPGPILFFAAPAFAAFTLPFLLQTTAEIPLAGTFAPALLLALLMIGAGGGLLAAHVMQRRWTAASTMGNYPVISGALAAALCALIVGGYWTGLFPEIYRAWYEGTTGPGLLLPGLGLTLGLAAFSASMATRDAAAPARFALPALAGSVMVGLLLALLLRDTLPVHMAALFLAVPALLVATWEFVRWYQKTISSGILLALLLLAGYVTFPKHQPEFRNYFDPTAFMITGDEQTPAGRLTLLRSRDYDDRFYTLFWNQSHALTQSSRAVQNDLYRMGHLPMLMRPDAGRVLLLGLGSALPLEAVKMHAPRAVDLVEPMEATLRLAKTTYGTVRPWRQLEDVRKFIERAPAFLARGGDRYDVIISAEPFAAPGVDPALFTETYFRDAKARLADGGLLMQWLPVARLDLDAMRRVFAAALAVFPQTQLWLSSADPESAMIGILASNSAPEKMLPSAAAHERLLEDPLLRFHLQQIQLDRFALVAACYASDRQGLQVLTGDAAPYTLCDPVVPVTQRDLQEEVSDVDRLLSARSEPTSLLAAQPDSTRELAREILASRPAILRARVAALGGDDSSTVRILGEALNRAPRNGEVRRVLGDVLLRQAAGYVGSGDYATAVALLNGGLQLLPLNTYMLRLFMIASFNIGDREASALAIDGIKRIDPSHAGFRDNQATIRAQQGATDDALLLYENAITLDQTNEEFFCNMASFHYSQGRSWEAIRVLDQATERAYYTAKPWYLKGMFYGEQGRLSFAREAFERYLDVATPIDPNRVDVERRLIQLRESEEN